MAIRSPVRACALASVLQGVVDRGMGHLLALTRPETVGASGDRQAGDKPLDVPLRRPGQRLVEVVDVEKKAALSAGQV
jgi:hypothetical protein